MKPNLSLNLVLMVSGALCGAVVLPGQVIAVEVWPGSHSAPAFADGSIRQVFCDLASLMEGQLGALLFTAAGVMGIVASALGNFRQSINALVVGVSAATITASISLYFGDFNCSAVNQNTASPGGAGRTTPVNPDQGGAGGTRTVFGNLGEPVEVTKPNKPLPGSYLDLFGPGSEESSRNSANSAGADQRADYSDPDDSDSTDPFHRY